MKHLSAWISVCLLSSALCAQTVIFSAKESASSSAADDTSIDLLKSSFSNSDVSGVYDGVPIKKKKNSERNETDEQEAEALRKLSSASMTDFSSLGLFPANKLDLSLTPGGSAESFGTQPTVVEQDIENNNALIERAPNAAATSQPAALSQPSAQTAVQSSAAQPTATQKAPGAVAASSSAQTISVGSSSGSAARGVPPGGYTLDKKTREELEYAARQLAQQTEKGKTTGRSIPQAASKQGAVPLVKTSAKRPFNPNDYRPGVKWKRADSTHFIIYNQVRENGIGSANMSMIFEAAYETLRRNIPWMMSGKVRVFVYQDFENYQRYEPNVKDWTRALAYPTRGEIVVYDEPGKQQELKEVFTHELVHVFTQQFFDKHKTNRLMTPTWLDEGLAVFMEDQVYNGSKGGPWANDLRVLRLAPQQSQATTSFANGNFENRRTPRNAARKGKTVKLMPFDQFMQEGSLAMMESRNKTQQWYLQAYAMVRFLLNPAGGSSPSNRMQFEQFTRLLAQGEQMRNPATGFPVKDAKGQPVYQLYSVDKALDKTYRYNSVQSFEDAFWRWAEKVR